MPVIDDTFPLQPAEAEQPHRTAIGAKIAGGAVATGLFISALLFMRPDSGRDNDATPAGPSDPTEIIAPVVPQADPREETSEQNESADPSAVDMDVFGPFDQSGDEPLLDGDTLDAIFAGDDQGPAPDHSSELDVGVEADLAVEAYVGLRSLCPSVVHQPIEDQDAASGIWVRGEVYGLESGWIWVEGPTINGGESVQIPVVDGAFDGPLGINSYGDHEITFFDVTDGDGHPHPVDLGAGFVGPDGGIFPSGPNGGLLFPVGPDEGPVFEQECFDFPAPAVDAISGDSTSPSPEPVAEVDLTAEVQQFVDGFVEAHRSGDVDTLRSTLHPSVGLAFGDDVCTRYIADTVGSIVEADLVDVGAPRPLDLDTPNGPISFVEAIPVTIDLLTVDGATVTNEANFPTHDGELQWLTTCGVEMP